MSLDDHEEKLVRVLSKLEDVSRVGNRHMARCPAHADRTPSLSVRLGDRGVLLRCYAGCTFEEVCAAIGISPESMFNDYEPREPPRAGAAPQPKRALSAAPIGFTVATFAAEKRLPIELLGQYGVHDGIWQQRRCVHFEHLHRDGRRARTHVRLTLAGANRFRWAGDGDEVIAYEPDQGKLARGQRELVIVEGESDTLTLLAAGCGALGLPGSDQARLIRPYHIEGIDHVYVVREPGQGGDTFAAKVPLALDALGFRGGVHILSLPGAKDVSALYLHDPIAFGETMAGLMDAARQPPPRSRSIAALIDAQAGDGVALPTGFTQLDRALDDGGLPTGSMVVIVGGPGSRKTGLGTHFADVLSRQDAAVLFMANDESRRSVITRLGQRLGFCRRGLRDHGDIGAATRAEHKRREEALGRTLHIVELDDEEDAQTIEDAHAELLRMAGRHRPRVLIIDSLQTCRCARAETLERPDQRAITDAKIAALKRIRRTGTIIVLISETNRGFYAGRLQQTVTKEQVMGAARESSGVEFGVDAVIGLVRDRDDDQLVELVVAKCRIGEEPRFMLRWDRDRATLNELTAEAQLAVDSARIVHKSEERAKARRSSIYAEALELVRRQPGISRTQLRAALRRSRTAVNEAVDELIYDKKVREEGGGHGKPAPIFPLPEGSE